MIFYAAYISTHCESNTASSISGMSEDSAETAADWSGQVFVVVMQRDQMLINLFQ